MRKYTEIMIVKQSETSDFKYIVEKSEYLKEPMEFGIFRGAGRTTTAVITGIPIFSNGYKYRFPHLSTEIVKTRSI